MIHKTTLSGFVCYPFELDEVMKDSIFFQQVKGVYLYSDLYFGVN